MSKLFAVLIMRFLIDNPTKLFLNLYLAKFLDISAKSFCVQISEESYIQSKRISLIFMWIFIISNNF